MAGQWEDVEEIFAHVTGFYRATDVDEKAEQ
jgi:hypothetical protein